MLVLSNDVNFLELESKSVVADVAFRMKNDRGFYPFPGCNEKIRELVKDRTFDFDDFEDFVEGRGAYERVQPDYQIDRLYEKLERTGDISKEKIYEDITMYSSSIFQRYFFQSNSGGREAGINKFEAKTYGFKKNAEGGMITDADETQEVTEIDEMDVDFIILKDLALLYEASRRINWALIDLFNAYYNGHGRYDIDPHIPEDNCLIMRWHSNNTFHPMWEDESKIKNMNSQPGFKFVRDAFRNDDADISPILQDLYETCVENNIIVDRVDHNLFGEDWYNSLPEEVLEAGGSFRIALENIDALLMEQLEERYNEELMKLHPEEGQVISSLAEEYNSYRLSPEANIEDITAFLRKYYKVNEAEFIPLDNRRNPLRDNYGRVIKIPLDALRYEEDADLACEPEEMKASIEVYRDYCILSPNGLIAAICENDYRNIQSFSIPDIMKKTGDYILLKQFWVNGKHMWKARRDKNRNKW